MSPFTVKKSSEGKHVHTSSDGRKYVIADEFMKLPEVRKQLEAVKRLRKEAPKLFRETGK